MKRLAVLLALTATPAMAKPGPFVTLFNTDFVVLIAFLVFVGVLLYVKVPRILTNALDNRAAGIRRELDEARDLREEAESLLASYKRKQAEVAEQSERIIKHARAEAAEAATQAKADLKLSIERRLAAAQDQIASAQAGAIRDVRERAIQVAVAAASQVIADNMSAAHGNRLIDEAIEDVGQRLN